MTGYKNDDDDVWHPDIHGSDVFRRSKLLVVIHALKPNEHFYSISLKCWGIYIVKSSSLNFRVSFEDIISFTLFLT